MLATDVTYSSQDPPCNINLEARKEHMKYFILVMVFFYFCEETP